MGSWNQNNSNLTVGQAQFNPYNQWNNFRLPVYKAEPIHGENAAWQFPMAPGSEIYLPDADKDIIWWIRVDQNGGRNVMGFDVVPHHEPEPVDMDQILQRLNVLEEKVNAKQNKPNQKRPNPAPAAESTATE